MILSSKKTAEKLQYWQIRCPLSRRTELTRSKVSVAGDGWVGGNGSMVCLTETLRLRENFL